MTAKRTILGAAAVSLVAAIVFRPGTAARRWARRAMRRARGRARHVGDRLRGVVHHLCRGDRSVDDHVLGDRVRSALGPVTRDLDVPHVHVMVDDGVVLLHGDVARDHDRDVIEQRASEVAGVRGVESYLHVGLLRSDTRPSAGRAVHPPSEARRRLERAAERGGAIREGEAARAVRAVLATFLERIPEGERHQVATHLPADVRALTRMPRRLGGAGTRVRTIEELVATVSDVDPGLGATRARLVTDAVLGELSQLIPEERDDVAAILPADLRRLWQRSRSQVPQR
ncbi:MAG TPA: DUF2267 domain-containing protein [Acidimicrobiales bacterium]|nr:DUF2267 domain-containing protein [Acidimicrobiales bacterium]